MQDSRAETNWKQITLFLITLGVLILCASCPAAFLLSASWEPSYWPSSRGDPTTGSVPRSKIRPLCATIALIPSSSLSSVPTYFLAQELGKQALAIINSFRNGAHQDKITNYIANHPALAARIEEFTSSIDLNNAARSAASLCRRQPRRFRRPLCRAHHPTRCHALPSLLPPPRPRTRALLPSLTPASSRRRDRRTPRTASATPFSPPLLAASPSPRFRESSRAWPSGSSASPESSSGPSPSPPAL